MDKISMPPLNYTDIMMRKAQAVTGNAYISLLEVMNKVEKAHIQPMGKIRSSSNKVDTYA